MITQKELKEALNYDPESGLFTWKSRRRGVKKDLSAGTALNGYCVIRINGMPQYAHRLAWLYMTGDLPSDQIDHINQVKDDNRIINLRQVTNKENQRNRRLHKNNNSGITGVVWVESVKKWFATIGVDGESIRLGYFECKFEAVCARKSANNYYCFHPNHGNL